MLPHDAFAPSGVAENPPATAYLVWHTAQPGDKALNTW